MLVVRAWKSSARGSHAPFLVGEPLLLASSLVRAQSNQLTCRSCDLGNLRRARAIDQVDACHESPSMKSCCQ
jgi:hypothetical protein